MSISKGLVNSIIVLPWGGIFYSLEKIEIDPCYTVELKLKAKTVCSMDTSISVCVYWEGSTYINARIFNRFLLQRISVGDKESLTLDYMPTCIL